MQKWAVRRRLRAEPPWNRCDCSARRRFGGCGGCGNGDGLSRDLGHGGRLWLPEVGIGLGPGFVGIALARVDSEKLVVSSVNGFSIELLELLACLLTQSLLELLLVDGETRVNFTERLVAA